MWALPPSPLGGKHSRSPGDGPNIPAPHGYLYQDSLSFSGLVWPLSPLLSWVTWVEGPALCQGKRPPQSCSGGGTHYLPMACPQEPLGLTEQKCAHGGQGLGCRHESPG